MRHERDPSMRAVVRELVSSAPSPPALDLRAEPRSPLRRRVAAASIGVVALGLAVAGVLAAVHRPSGTAPATSGRTATSATAPPSPYGDLEAPVAIAGGDDVRIVTRAGVVTIRGPQTCCVQWSGDRRWVAFLSGDAATSTHATGDLVVARADGAQRGVVAHDVSTFSWSARDDLLAYGTASSVVIVGVDGAFHGQSATVARGAATDVAWAPAAATRDQKLALAVSDPTKYVASLRVADVVPGQCRSLTSCVDVGPPLNIGAHDPHFALRIASWRPDGGALAVWDETLENNGRLDGLPLLLVSLDGRPPAVLGSGVVQPDWVRWSPDGLHLVFVAGVGRTVMDSPRELRVCDAQHGTCRTITADSIQARDPAWSADSRTIDFTSISAAANEAFLQSPAGKRADWRQLFAERQLWSIQSDGSGAARAARVPAGVGAPQALADVVIVVHDRAVEQVGLRTGHVLVVGRLVEPPNTDPYADEPLYMPDDAVYEGVESGPGGWSRWFAVAPPG